ncbi:MAG TPA: AAA family ATPase [Blastocatellia bacterium]|jgi:MoxR-like ATPase|nr:AAA family ATPase [Blastocatellia bacterium]
MAIDTQEVIREDELLEKLIAARDQIRSEVRKVIIAQDEVVDQTLISLFVGGHSLVTGVPGLAKTLLIRTVANVLDLSFKRIQFTPDLMPSDITGTDIIEEDRATGHRRLEFIQGPLFANIILADEINRTPPKTQAALLEAMQEGSVTIQGTTYQLPRPFYVLATQNPIEMEGTYPLPEAQLDRFMFNIKIGYLSEDDEVDVVSRTTSVQDFSFERNVTGEDILAFQRLVRRVPAAESVTRYAVRLVGASRPLSDSAPDFIRRWVNWGASLRASQFLILGGKARAVMMGRYNVSVEDVRALAYPILRHRILLNFHAESEKVKPDDVIRRLIETVPEPKSGL